MTVTGNIAAWTASLSHDEISGITDVASVVALGAGPEIAAVIVASVGYLETIDLIGGNNGVNITGVGGAIIVTPGGIPVIGTALGLLTGIVTGSVDLITKALGAIINVLKSPFGAGHGQLHADEDNIGNEEQFVLCRLANGKVTISAFTGFFCADSNDGDCVNANRPTPSTWEQFDMLRNPDGTVRFMTYKGNWILAERNDGWRLNDLPTGVNFAQEFHLIQNRNGTISLKSIVSNQFVSAAP